MRLEPSSRKPSIANFQILRTLIASTCPNNSKSMGAIFVLLTPSWSSRLGATLNRAWENWLNSEIIS